MKALILLIALFSLSECARANSIELGQNLITIHTFARSVNFQNKHDEKGIVMTNPMTFLRYNNLALLTGQDSAGSKIWGGLYFSKLNDYTEFFFGGYSHNQRDWEKRGIKSDFLFKSGDRSIQPVFGLNLHLTLWQIDDTFSIKGNNTYTPATINLFISIKKEF